MKRACLILTHLPAGKAGKKMTNSEQHSTPIKNKSLVI